MSRSINWCSLLARPFFFFFFLVAQRLDSFPFWLYFYIHLWLWFWLFLQAHNFCFLFWSSFGYLFLLFAMIPRTLSPHIYYPFTTNTCSSMFDLQESECAPSFRTLGTHIFQVNRYLGILYYRDPVLYRVKDNVPLYQDTCVQLTRS